LSLRFPSHENRRRWLIAGVVVGSILTSSSLIALAGTVFGIVRAFKQLDAQSVGDPSYTSVAIGETLVSAFAGMIVGLPGIILLVFSLSRFRRLPSQTPPSIGGGLSAMKNPLNDDS